MGKRITITESAWMSAPPNRVYGVISDYRDMHPRILPDEFRGLEVERGGIGEGTVIRFAMRAFGRTRESRAAITEPVPGRVLVETVLDGSGIVTTFTVKRVRDGTEVTISTAVPVRGGVPGRIEGFLAERYLRGVYRKELGLLAGVACLEVVGQRS